MKSPTDLDLPDLLLSWEIALKSEGRARSTLTSYLRGVTTYLRWCDANGYPEQLHKNYVRAWVAELLAEGAEPATAKIRQLAVRRFSAWLAEEGEVAEDPLLGLKPPKLITKVIRSLDDEECAALIKACTVTTYRGGVFMDRRDEALVRLMLETGMRCSEVLGLELGDVDVKRGVLLVRKTKNKQERIVPFGPSTARALDRYQRARKSHALAGTRRLWLGALSQGLSDYHGLRMALKHRAERAGIKDFHPHLMRHTAASRWLAAGGSEGGAMSIMGWSDRAMLDRYVASTAANRAVEESRGLGLGDF